MTYFKKNFGPLLHGSEIFGAVSSRVNAAKNFFYAGGHQSSADWKNVAG
jgi:hypothetical protein